jgi:phenylpyruvate tautomerase PptA (4-oxalocrotonate tautomerase family)
VVRPISRAGRAAAAQAWSVPAANFRYGASYLGIARSDNLVLIQLTVSNTRTVEQKKALFRRIAELLGENPGIRPEDVFVNLVEVAKENWSFGHGLAQYA